MDVTLYGGAGYIGHHLAEALLLDGHKVTSIDTAPNKVPGVINDDVDKLEGGDAIVMLACPRNTGPLFSIEDAAKAVERGWHIKTHGYFKRVIYISSMSVYDREANPYASHKMTAEVIARLNDAQVIRLGTVLGSNVGMPYRYDLGLHRIAYNMMLDPGACWVAENIRRHVITIDQAVECIAEQATRDTEEDHPNLVEVSWGAVRYADIVPLKIPRQVSTTAISTVSHANDMRPCNVKVLQNEFLELSELIRSNQTWPI